MDTRSLASRAGRALFAAILCSAELVSAHCDSLDGPVVTAARQALEAGDVRHVLIWVPAERAPELEEVYRQVRAVRASGPAARELADRHFFETAVRLHRAGEGEPFGGLKPAGQDLGPAIPAADLAAATGAVEPLGQLLVEAVEGRLHRLHGRVVQARGFDPADVEAGRAYVAAYVEFVHFAEGLHQLAAEGAHGHGQGPQEAGHRPAAH